MKETITLEPLKPNIAYEAQVDLSLFDRATDIADNYQEYRITKLEWKYTPHYDTYTDASGAVGLPYLYSKRMVYPPPGTITLNWLKALGAKPRRLDDKTLQQNYVPNINLFGSSFLGPAPAAPVLNALKPDFKPWLSTHQDNPATPGNAVMDKTPHQGHAFYIEQYQPAGGNAEVCSLEVTAYFEFRKPWDLAAIAGVGNVKIGSK